MTSRGTDAVHRADLVTATTPARSAGEPGATATTCGNVIHQAYRPTSLA